MKRIYSFLLLIIFLSISDKVFSQNTNTTEGTIEQKLHIKPNLAPSKTIIVIGGMGNNLSQHSGFCMLGLLGKQAGGYIKIKSNGNSSTDKYSKEILSTTQSYFSSINKGYTAYSLGVLIKISNPIILSLGGGLGNRWVDWKAINGDMLRVTDMSHNGYLVEFSGIIKWNQFLFNVGLSSIQFKYVETDLGIGFNF